MTAVPALPKPPARSARWRGLWRPRAALWLTAGVLALCVLGATLGLVHTERANARDLAAAALQAAADTYESQLIRSLREIDQALRMLAYMAVTQPDALQRLRQAELLPPEQVFRASLQHEPSVPPQRLVGSVGLALDMSPASAGTALRFSRPVAGQPTLRAVLEVDRAYFVAAYDAERLGRLGAIVLEAAGGQRLAQHGELPASGSRWQTQRELFDLPLTARLALSIDEREATLRTRHAALGALCGAMVLLIVGVTSLLVRMQQHLERERQAHAAQVQHMALHDALTGLANRSRLECELTAVRHAPGHPAGRVTLLFLDLDGFKVVNDTYGHTTGDALLCEVARRLTRDVRPGDLVARLGGDEFVVMLQRTGDPAEALPVAQRMLCSVGQEALVVDGRVCRVTTSIGVASLSNGHAATPEEALRRADAALYAAKRAGKNRIAVATGSLPADVRIVVLTA